jgi:large subunit ribosomal protein L18e
MKDNQQLQTLIFELKRKSVDEKVNLWKRIADDLERPTRIRRVVNLSKISRYLNDDEIALVPGKVLGGGDLEKKVTVAAFTFSKQAVDKIKQKNGKTMNISELMKSNPKGSKVRIIG